tara:strand:+ start:1231 stop:1497 length:267 start_codon:yes stop_codon:yes gene_type:complete
MKILRSIEIHEEDDGMASAAGVYVLRGESVHESGFTGPEYYEVLPPSPYWLVKKEAARIALRYGVPIVDCIVLNAGVPLSESFAKMEK